MNTITKTHWAIEFLISEFDRVYDDAIEEFIIKTKQFLKDNREKIIEKRIVSMYEKINPHTVWYDIKVYFENINKK